VEQIVSLLELRGLKVKELATVIDIIYLFITTNSIDSELRENINLSKLEELLANLRVNPFYDFLWLPYLDVQDPRPSLELTSQIQVLVIRKLADLD